MGPFRHAKVLAQLMIFWCAFGGVGQDRFCTTMTIPDFQRIMRPVLALVADGQDHAVTDIRERLADEFELTQEELEEMLPSGRAKTFMNRVGWAVTYLYQTKLLDRPKRSVYRITPRGREVLAENLNRVDLKVLAQFEELHEFRAKAPTGGSTATTEIDAGSGESEHTPEEQMDAAYRLLRSALAADLLERVKEQAPAFFEQLVLDVLQAMGYGGTRESAVSRLGQSGDEGIDGVGMPPGPWTLDRLGLSDPAGRVWCSCQGRVRRIPSSSVVRRSSWSVRAARSRMSRSRSGSRIRRCGTGASRPMLIRACVRA